MPRIYACYRHDDNPHVVGRVVGDLRSCFGLESIFYDVDRISPGHDWPERLQRELADCDVLLAFIGSEWHRSWDDDIGPRLWHPTDWVRREICTAVDSTNKTVIPVLVDDATMPKQSALPDDCSLKKIPDLNFAKIRHADYDADIEIIIQRLGTITKSGPEVETWLSLSQMQVLSRTQVHQRLARITPESQ